MAGDLYFMAVFCAGTMLLTCGALVGIWLKQRFWNRAERLNLQLAMQLSAYATFAALLPFMLSYFFDRVGGTWRMASFLLAVVLLLEVGRLILHVQRFSVQWPQAITLLLALSGIMLTIELLNVLWGRLAVYALGVLWLLLLAVTQWIAFVIYDRATSLPKYYIASAQIAPDQDRLNGNRDARPVYTHHGVLGDRLQRDNPAGHPYTTTNHYTDDDTAPYSNTRSAGHRLAFTRTRHGHGRTVADPTAGTDAHTRV